MPNPNENPSMDGDDNWNHFDSDSQNNQSSENISNIGESEYGAIKGNSNAVDSQQANTSQQNSFENNNTTQANPASDTSNQYQSMQNQNPFGDKHPRMAGFWERFIALFIDGLIVGATGGMINFVVGIVFELALSAGEVSNSVYTGTSIVLGGINWLISLGVTIGFYGYFYSKKGQTPGKQIMKIKVISSREKRYLTWSEAALRETVGKWISSALIGLGYMWYFISSKRQAWHDSIVKSYVVKTDEIGNIYMDGPVEYKKDIVRASLPCGCFLLFFIVFIGIFISTFGSIDGSIKNFYNTMYQDDINEYQQNYLDEIERMEEDIDQGNLEIKDSTNDVNSNNPVDAMFAPTDNIADANDAVRASDTNTILVALNQYIVDNLGELPASLEKDGLFYEVGSCSRVIISACDFVEPNCIDLGSELRPYLSEIPQDPTSGTDSNSGYAIRYGLNDEITVRACNPETTSIIQSVQ